MMCLFERADGGDRFWGYSDFTSRLKLEEECVQNDTLVIDCDLRVYAFSVLEEARAIPAVTMPLSEMLSADLGSLLESKEMTDVTFLVDGETIPAHKLLLAARSPVFKAALYGPMSESTVENVPIVDMKASVFKTMLHYIYTDSLPANATGVGHEQSNSSLDEAGNAMQHLLEAADRYGLDKLKSICEDNLCKTLNIETVATALALAHSMAVTN